MTSLCKYVKLQLPHPLSSQVPPSRLSKELAENWS